MSNYTPTVNFAGKDSLATDNPAKVISGAEFELEFNNIAAAIASKTETVPVYPEFEDESSSSSEGVAVVTNPDIGTDYVLTSVDFDFTRPSTSIFEYCIGVNGQVGFSDLDSDTVNSNSEIRLRITNNQTSVNVILDGTLRKVKSLIVEGSIFDDNHLYSYQMTYPTSVSSFSSSSLTQLLGTSTLGYKAELIAREPIDTFGSQGEARVTFSGHCFLYIKELFQ